MLLDPNDSEYLNILTRDDHLEMVTPSRNQRRKVARKKS